MYLRPLSLQGKLIAGNTGSVILAIAVASYVIVMVHQPRQTVGRAWRLRAWQSATKSLNGVKDYGGSTQHKCSTWYREPENNSDGRLQFFYLVHLIRSSLSLFVYLPPANETFETCYEIFWPVSRFPRQTLRSNRVPLKSVPAWGHERSAAILLLFFLEFGSGSTKSADACALKQLDWWEPYGIILVSIAVTKLKKGDLTPEKKAFS